MSVFVYFCVDVFVCGCVCVFLCWFVCVDMFVCGCGCVCVCVYIWGKRRWGKEKLVHFAWKREKKNAKCEINKIIIYIATVIVHIHSYNNCADMYSYCNKCVNIHNFRMIDVRDFLSKICKIYYFLYFAKFYINALTILYIYIYTRARDHIHKNWNLSSVNIQCACKVSIKNLCELKFSWNM